MEKAEVRNCMVKFSAARLSRIRPGKILAWSVILTCPHAPDSDFILVADSH